MSCFLSHFTDDFSPNISFGLILRCVTPSPLFLTSTFKAIRSFGNSPSFLRCTSARLFPRLLLPRKPRDVLACFERRSFEFFPRVGWTRQMYSAFFGCLSNRWHNRLKAVSLVGEDFAFFLRSKELGSCVRGPLALLLHGCGVPEPLINFLSCPVFHALSLSPFSAERTPTTTTPADPDPVRLFFLCLAAPW